ncbi:thioredoxin [Oenococcus kitaharae]|uniref:thioredoxin family protein n=1 Tax=Oenococcus kitaharae TaxID=336988 RepID=UPI0008630FFD|nr:thioredoxin family protein [Oenococcus kitaharae]OEY83865.1 thioredoxin [Oenococcus kitaharae]
MTLIKRVGKTLAVIVVVLIVSGFAGHQYVNHVKKQRPIVTLAKHSDKVLFFYRDDCADCQSIFHQIYWQNAVSHNVVFINMNQPKNRSYIQKYQLTSVPTLIHGCERYSGTNLKKMKEVMR